MRTVSPISGLLLSLSVGTAAFGASDTPPHKHFCLDASLVVGTGVIDENTIIYRMQGGTVWKNTLRQSCPNLKFASGFSETVRSNEICANQQIITVLGTGNTCQLGDFTPSGTSTPPVK